MASSLSAVGAEPDFGAQIRPILSDHCFACHGPDEHERQASLRLDTEEGLGQAISREDLASSELLARIESHDPDTVMPPPAYNKPITADQQRLLREWVEAGATFEQHWAFVPPTKISPPSHPAVTGDKHPIDAFLEATAVEMGLNIAPMADRETLLRRLVLGLTGLPPTPEMREAFLNDSSPEAYAKLVDQLLESPHFGEHFGRYWLDLVRYGDTHGLHLDNYREMWPYRDWVIDAFNANKPYNEFVTEQLAGDLIPDATTAQRVASGFNRLHVTTNEGGSIYDEVFARNVIDTTDAFGTVFLALTTGCAVCHDHKFDPISMRDYYSLSAYFNSLDGSAMDGNIKDSPPHIKLPSDEDLRRIDEANAMLSSIRNEKVGPIESVDAAQSTWEQSLLQSGESRIEVLAPKSITTGSGIETKTLDDSSVEVVGDVADKDTLEWVTELPQGASWQSLRLEAITETPEGRVGASPNGNAVLSEIKIERSDPQNPGQWIAVPIQSAVADVEQDADKFAIRNAIDGNLDEARGWAVAGHEKTGPRTAWFMFAPIPVNEQATQLRVQLHYVSQFAKHQFRRVRLAVSTGLASVPQEQRIQDSPWHVIGPFEPENVEAGYDDAFASETKTFNAETTVRFGNQDYAWQVRDDLFDVRVHTLEHSEERPVVNVLHRRLTAPSDQEVLLLLSSDDGHVVSLNGKQVAMVRGPHEHQPLAHEYKLALKRGDNDLSIKLVSHGGNQRWSTAFRSAAIEVPVALAKWFGTAPDERSPDDQASLRKYYRSVHCQHADWVALNEREAALSKELEQIDRDMPRPLVWKELANPREARIYLRGQYDQLGDVVPRATPSFLPGMPTDAPQNRLGLAQWLVAENHPLTARVAVNRIWQSLFGVGIVKTSEDFGSQGQPPSHPELLDWLAVDFREQGWDVKRFVKMLVMTDAFQRSAIASHEDRLRDPENRYLARGPRFRLDAEVIRDQSLAISGLLVDRLGGPSVKPPQPPGLWEAVGYSGSNTVRFTPDTGDATLRRSVYTFWKRTSPPPQMTTFDAPSRETCTVRRERTNTPLQALLMLNEPQQIDAAKQLAKHLLERQELASDAARIEWLYPTVTSFRGTAEDHAELVSLLGELTAYYTANIHLAEQLTGEANAYRAAWTVVASTLLNLDRVVCN